MPKLPKYLFILFLFSCKKNEPLSDAPVKEQPCFHSYPSEDLKKINYQIGSYWVLFDSLQIRYDSLVVSSNFSTTVEFPTHKGLACPNKADRRVHTIDLYSYDLAGAAIKASVNENYVWGLTSEDKQAVIHGDPDCYISVCGITVYADYDSIPHAPIVSSSVTERFDSLYISNQLFKRVIKITIGTKAKNTSYVNAESGFLRFYATDTTGNVIMNKTLVRSKIIK